MKRSIGKPSLFSPAYAGIRAGRLPLSMQLTGCLWEEFPAGLKEKRAARPEEQGCDQGVQ